MAEKSDFTLEQLALFDERAKFPITCSTYFLFAPPPSRVSSANNLNNGTITLVSVNGRKFGITAYHVVERYRERIELGEQLIFYVGNVVIDPEACLVSESKELDLAVLDLAIVNPLQIRGGGEIPCAFHEPRTWSSGKVRAGDFVLLGGWPGSGRGEIAREHLIFGSFSSGGSEVQSVQTDVFTCRIEFDACFVSSNRGATSLPALPGISGGPVFVETELESGMTVFDFVGVIFEYHEGLDILRARPISLIGVNGQKLS